VFLGIDIGTSGVKVVMLDEAGTVVCEASAPLETSRPQPLWSEQDPQHWWRATCSAIRQLDAAHRSRTACIGLAGQMHGATLLGADDKPLRPAILWNDGRSFAECADLESAQPDSRAITGNLAMPGFTAPKLQWVRRHEPDIFARISKILLPKDFVRLCMTGDHASDVSDSAGTLWLDVARREWSDAMLGATGLVREQMPCLYEGCEISGKLRPQIADEWGMGQVPVVAGAGDNAAGAAGIGIVSDGDALLSLGTSGVIFVATGEFRANPDRAVHAFCHCIPGTWHQMAVHLSAASCVDWAARQLGLLGPAQVFEVAAQSGTANGPELFLPFLSGERTPYNDPHLRAGFLELNNDTTPARLAAAVLEGVAFAHAEGLDALRAAGTVITALNVIGGGTRSRYWGAIIASTLGLPLHYLDGGEIGPALGAAKLASMGLNGTSAQEACTRQPVRATIDPDPRLTAQLSEKRARFRAAVAATRSISKG
jgi:xylulokinase